MEDTLNDVQFQILDALYFVEPFENLLDEVEATRPVIIDELRSMIDKGWIQVMEYSQEKGDYIRTSIFDGDHFENYSFLATKEGLLKHNGH